MRKCLLSMASLVVAFLFPLSCTTSEDDSSNPSSSSIVLSSSSVGLSSSSVVLSSSSVGLSSSSVVLSSSSAGLSSSNIALSSSATLSNSSVIVVSSSSSFSGDDISNYRTVRIGTQTWIAENLNYDVLGSKCYNNEDSNCAKYGRLYDWATAMNLPSSCNSSTCASQINAKHQGICPGGWHIPSNDDWDALMTEVGGSSIAGRKLKSTSGWNYGDNSTDDYGFSALPGGACDLDGSFYYVVSGGYWWSASENNSKNAYYRYMFYGVEDVYYYGDSKIRLRSVRCLQD